MFDFKRNTVSKYRDDNEKLESKEKTRKSKFSSNEDHKLKDLVERYGTNSWSLISSKFQGRNARQCRDRWNNYLNPENKQTKWTMNEDELLLNLFPVFGRKWSKLAFFFPKRTSVSVRNRCRQLLKQINDNNNDVINELENQVSFLFESNKNQSNFICDNHISCIEKLKLTQNEQIIEIDNNYLDNVINQSKVLFPPCINLPFDYK